MSFFIQAFSDMNLIHITQKMGVEGVRHYGQGACPAVEALTWEHPSNDGSAHMLVFGEERDKWGTRDFECRSFS